MASVPTEQEDIVWDKDSWAPVTMGQTWRAVETNAEVKLVD